FDNYQEYEDLCITKRDRIEYFFKHYKDLENGKWVEIIRWDSTSCAKELIVESIDLAEMTSMPALNLTI
ncbi:MAG: inorganic diphosphatase, partial [Planctomycetota bacterium]